MRWRPTLAAVIASGVLATLGACTARVDEAATSGPTVEVRAGQKASATSADGALVVDVPGDSITGAGELTIAPVRQDGLAGWSVELTGGAELIGPAELTFTSPEPTSIDAPAPLVMYTDGPTRELAAVGGVTLEGSVARVTTEHFSAWFVTWWDQALADSVAWAHGALDAIYSADAVGQQPRCPGEDTARERGFTTTGSNGSQVLWCLGETDSGVELGVTNARGYAVAAEHSPGLTVAAADPDPVTTQVTNLVHEEPATVGNLVTLLRPGAEARYSVSGSPTVSDVTARPSVAGYLATATRFAIDTLARLTPYLGLGDLTPDQLLQLLDVGTCFADDAATTSDSIRTAADASTFLDDALRTGIDCGAGALERAGLAQFEGIVADGVTWVLGGVHAALDAHATDVDAVLDPAPYRITVTAPATTEALITGTGIGPAQIGMSVDALPPVTELGIVLDDTFDWCQTVFGDYGGAQLAASATPDGSGKVYGVWLYGGSTPTPNAPRTAAGAGLGTGKGRLITLHPGGQWSPLNPDFETDVIAAKYTVDVDGGPVTFGVADERVTAVVVGTDAFPIEFCG